MGLLLWISPRSPPGTGAPAGRWPAARGAASCILSGAAPRSPALPPPSGTARASRIALSTSATHPPPLAPGFPHRSVQRLVVPILSKRQLCRGGLYTGGCTRPRNINATRRSQLCLTSPPPPQHTHTQAGRHTHTRARASTASAQPFPHASPICLHATTKAEAFHPRTQNLCCRIPAVCLFLHHRGSGAAACIYSFLLTSTSSPLRLPLHAAPPTAPASSLPSFLPGASALH